MKELELTGYTEKRFSSVTLTDLLNKRYFYLMMLIKIIWLHNYTWAPPGIKYIVVISDWPVVTATSWSVWELWVLFTHNSHTDHSSRAVPFYVSTNERFDCTDVKIVSLFQALGGWERAKKSSEREKKGGKTKARKGLALSSLPVLSPPLSFLSLAFFSLVLNYREPGTSLEIVRYSYL